MDIPLQHQRHIVNAVFPHLRDNAWRKHRTKVREPHFYLARHRDYRMRVLGAYSTLNESSEPRDAPPVIVHQDFIWLVTSPNDLCSPRYAVHLTRSRYEFWRWTCSDPELDAWDAALETVSTLYRRDVSGEPRYRLRDHPNLRPHIFLYPEIVEGFVSLLEVELAD